MTNVDQGSSGSTDTMSKTASNAFEKAKDIASNVADRGSDMLPEGVTHYVAENPMKTAAIAGAVVWLVSLLASGRPSGRSSPSSWSTSGRSQAWSSGSDLEDSARQMGREVTEQPIPVLIALAFGYGLAWAIHGQSRDQGHGQSRHRRF